MGFGRREIECDLEGSYGGQKEFIMFTYGRRYNIQRNQEEKIG
jgi:hypothetical protein